MKSWKIIICIIVGLGALGCYVYTWEYRLPRLEVHIFNLERGRGIFVRTPGNKTMLVGGGQNSQIIREMSSLMPVYSRTLDYVVIPSATPAQIGGLLEILERYEVEEVIMPTHMATSTVLSRLMKHVRSQQIHVTEVMEGDSIELEADVALRVLFPYEGFAFNKTSIPELGFFVSYKDTGAYFLGNLSKTIQKHLFKNLQLTTRSNILEYYHTMTNAKTSDELVKAIDPQFIFSTKEKTLHVVSDGAGWVKR